MHLQQNMSTGTEEAMSLRPAGGACSSNMLVGFREGDKTRLEAQYKQAMEFKYKTTFALVSAVTEKRAYEFLLSKGWKDTAHYAGNSDAEMHLLVLGMKPILKENPVVKEIRKRVRRPLSRLSRRTVKLRKGL